MNQGEPNEFSILLQQPPVIQRAGCPAGRYEHIGKVVVQRRAQSTLLITIFAAIVAFEIGTLLILTVEQYSPDANITTAGDAIW